MAPVAPTKEADIRKRWGIALAAVLVAGIIGLPGSASTKPSRYVVLYRAGTSLNAARAAVVGAGGTIVHENSEIGVATVVSSRSDFMIRVIRRPALVGATLDVPIGKTTAYGSSAGHDVKNLTAEERAAFLQRTAAAHAAAKRGEEPLASLQWDMAMIHATADGSYLTQKGNHRVLVGVIDTGIDASHPDIAPNFNAELSRNFTTDIPIIDGECSTDPDGSCSDPPNVDENGHGTHVAGIIGAAVNGIGIAGVAPGVSLVNIRAGQDSGFFFLQETVDALTYAGDAGVDVVNMSFFTDPWLYNCPNNSADTPEEQAQQVTIIEATQRAIDYARRHGVTPIAALGNEHTDLGNPTFDGTSPDYPPGTAKGRTVDNTCLDVPTETNGVISVSSIGPSQRKADYSNYGVEQTDVSAPGGWYRDGLGTDTYKTPGNLILSAYPESLAIANGQLDENGVPIDPFVVRDCKGEVCAYYQWLQGTSMAAPHAVGVAALLVAELGRRAGDNQSGLTLPPDVTGHFLYATATDHACPDPPLQSYEDVGRPPDWNALCTGDPEFNGFYGNGIVDALGAATAGR